MDEQFKSVEQTTYRMKVFNDFLKAVNKCILKKFSQDAYFQFFEKDKFIEELKFQYKKPKKKFNQDKKVFTMSPEILNQQINKDKIKQIEKQITLILNKHLEVKNLYQKYNKNSHQFKSSAQSYRKIFQLQNLRLINNVRTVKKTIQDLQRNQFDNAQRNVNQLIRHQVEECVWDEINLFFSRNFIQKYSTIEVQFKCYKVELDSKQLRIYYPKSEKVFRTIISLNIMNISYHQKPQLIMIMEIMQQEFQEYFFFNFISESQLIKWDSLLFFFKYKKQLVIDQKFFRYESSEQRSEEETVEKDTKQNGKQIKLGQILSGNFCDMVNREQIKYLYKFSDKR